MQSESTALNTPTVSTLDHLDQMDSLDSLDSTSSQHSMYTLVSSDGKKFEISKKACVLSKLLNTMMEQDKEETELPLNVESSKLEKVVVYLEHHSESDNQPKEIPKPLTQSFENVVSKWDYQFCDTDPNTLMGLMLAANYMDIKPLLDLSAAKIASLLKGKTTDEMRSTLNIENDFTPEEEAKIREENRWVEELP